MSTDSLKKKYLYKCLANFFGLTISLMTNAFVARALGPVSYGIFNYVTNFFLQINTFLDIEMPGYIYTRLSRNTRKNNLYSLFFFFGYIRAFLLMLLPVFTALVGVAHLIWPDQQLKYIFCGSLFASLSWFSQRTVEAMDAVGKTVILERFRIFQRAISAAFIALLFFTSTLNLDTYFTYNALTLLFLFALNWFYLKKFDPEYFIARIRFTKQEIVDWVQPVWKYSSPMIAYSLVWFIAMSFDRWMLQIYGGNEEQGLFGFALQISTFSFIFTGAITPLLFREYSIAFDNKDPRRMGQLFVEYLPLFYLLSAYFCCFLALNSAYVVQLFGGEKFTKATLALTLMSLAPIHQTFGQLSSSFFFATERTKEYRNLGVVSNLAGMLCIWFLFTFRERLFPQYSTSEALAFKTLISQIITVNLQLYFACRIISIPYGYFLANQFKSVSVLLTLAFATHSFTEVVLSGKSVIFSFLLSGILYTVLVALTCILIPEFMGIQRRIFERIKASLRIS